MPELTGLSLEPFRGDYEGLEKMAHSSWRDEYGISSFPNFYRPAFLRYLFGRIKDKDHLIAAYRGDEIVSFLGNIPHSFRFRGRVYLGTWSCLLVTRKELLRKGHAATIINEALRINQEYKYDFALATFETGHRSTLMLRKLQEEGNRLEWMKRLRVISRVIDLGRVEASEGLKTWEKAAVKLIGGARRPRMDGDRAVREYSPDDLEACLSLFNAYRDKIELARAWEAEEMAWELACPDV
ncbi:MAG: GNAT family N-acetyltransferase, partial [Candidatus Aminicenantes bacterium]|nr:GNAT family N-acetyltransferase [Candidatus Aminicenantes bacterium]